MFATQFAKGEKRNWSDSDADIKDVQNDFVDLLDITGRYISKNSFVPKQLRELYIGAKWGMNQ